jgi:hypothetical protein
LLARSSICAYRRTVALRLGFAVGVCAAVLAASPASAGWLAPKPLSPSNEGATSQALALGPDGRVVLAWTSPDGTEPHIRAAARPPGGQVEEPQSISDPTEFGCCSQLATDSQGNALLMWPGNAGYHWATRPAGAAGFGEAHTVTLPGSEQAGSFALAMSPAGDPAAVIITAEPAAPAHLRVRALTRSPTGDFQVSPALDDAAPDLSNFFSLDPVDLDVDGAGTFYATWTKFHGVTTAPTGSTSAVKVAVRSPGGTFGAAEDVATAVENTGDVAPDVRVSHGRAGVDAAGALSVAYVRTITSVSPYQSEILLRSRPPGGGTVPGSSFDAGSETVSPLVAKGPIELAFDMNGAGTGVAAWRSGQTPDSSVSACVRPPSGPCGMPQPLASGVSAPVVAIGATGAAVAAWQRNDVGAAAASFLPAGGTFGSPHEVGTGTNVFVPAEGIGVDALGNAVVLVDTYAPPNRTITAVVNDSAPPSIGALSVPSGEPGDPLAFAATVADVWSPFTAGWDFGDGSSAPGPAATHAYRAKGTFTAALTATDSEGNTATQSAAALVRRVPPRVLTFRMNHRVFAVGAKPTALSGARRIPRGTTFRLRLSEVATARMKIQRKRGRRWKTAGTLRRRAGTRVKRVPFSGRLRRKALRPGRYRAVLVAVDSDKNRSRPRTLGFRVVRR